MLCFLIEYRIYVKAIPALDNFNFNPNENEHERIKGFVNPQIIQTSKELKFLTIGSKITVYC